MNVIVQKLQKQIIFWCCKKLYTCVQYLKILIPCTYSQQLKQCIYQLINYCHRHLNHVQCHY